jgi:hypothetical protein
MDPISIQFNEISSKLCILLLVYAFDVIKNPEQHTSAIFCNKKDFTKGLWHAIPIFHYTHLEYYVICRTLTEAKLLFRYFYLYLHDLQLARSLLVLPNLRLKAAFSLE